MDTLTKLYGRMFRLHFLTVQKQLEAYNIHPGQPKILHVLAHKEGVTQVQLAKMLCVTPATINAMLKRMERDELITRVRSETDNRVTQIYLTDHGREVEAVLQSVMREVQDICFGNLSDDELEQAKRLFEKINKNMQEHVGLPDECEIEN